MFKKLSFQAWKSITMASNGAVLELSRSIGEIKHEEINAMKQGFECGVIAGLNVWSELHSWGDWKKAVSKSLDELKKLY